MINKIILASTLVLSVFTKINSQVIFEETFSNSIWGNGWTVIDANSDNNNWQVLNIGGFAGPFQSQGYVMLSASAFPGQSNYSPNDFVITPNIDLTSATGNVKLTFKLGSDMTTASGDFQDFVSVYVVTDASLSNLLASTPVHSQALTGGQAMFSFNYSINSSIGSNVKIAFRHHNCTDEGTLYLDDVKVEQFGVGTLSAQCPGTQNWTASQNGTTLTSLESLGTFSSTCAGGNVTYSQSPAIGSNLIQGANNVTISVTDNCGNLQTCQTTINYINNLSVSENYETFFSLSPNPSSGILRINNAEKIQKINIYNLDGKLVKVINENFSEIRINDLIPGNYLLKMFHTDGILDKKIILQ